jgi:hypothetical protein
LAWQLPFVLFFPGVGVLKIGSGSLWDRGDPGWAVTAPYQSPPEKVKHLDYEYFQYSALDTSAVGGEFVCRSGESLYPSAKFKNQCGLNLSQ